MALAGGLSAQFGMAPETTFGTSVTPTRFLEFNNDTVKRTIERIETAGLRPGRRVLREKQWIASRESVAGDVEFDVATNGFAMLLHHCLGEVEKVQPNAGSFPTVYEYKCTVGALDALSFTSQIAVGDINGTARAFTWAGCKIPKWEIIGDENAFLKLKASIDGASESISTALASASYSSTAVPLSYTNATIKIAGSEVPVMKFSIGADNKLKTDRFFMRGAASQQKKAQLENGIRPYTGKVNVEFSNLELYEKFTSGAVAEITAFYEGPEIAGSYKSAVEITLPAVRFDGETPQVPGPEIVDITLPIVALEPAAGGGKAVQITYRTTDSSE